MWTLEVTDLQGHKLDEIHNAQDRVFTFGLSRIPTVQFKLDSQHKLRDPLMSTDVYVKGYAGTTLKFHGIPTAAERVAAKNEKTFAITASGVLWRLTKRLAAKTGAGLIYSTATDRGRIAFDQINYANADNSTGIFTSDDPTTYSSYSTTTYKVEPYKPVSEVIAELGHALDGFDWEVTPIEYSDGWVGQWKAAPIFGSQKSGAVFEYGTGRNNISGISDQVSLDTMANKVYHISPAGVDAPAAPVVSASDPDSIAERGLYEEIAVADLSFLTMRQSLVEEHVRLRRFPRRVVTFSPRPYHRDEPGNVPVFGVDYDIGDWVPAHARDNNGEWFNGYFRVYGASVAVDRTGLESVTLTLTDEG